MVPTTVVTFVLATCLACGGCATLSRDASRSFQRAYHESRPPSRPLPVWAEWEKVTDAKLEDFYSKDSLEAIRASFNHARTDAIVGTDVCIKPTAKGKGNAVDAYEQKVYLLCVQRYVRYQNLGLMLSEMHCGAYLGALARAEGHQEFARETTSELGTATSAVMGLLKNATGITSAVTTTFGLLENSFRNYEMAYLPDQRVKNGMGVFQRARLELLKNYQEDLPTSLAMAEYRISYYASSCSLDWMQRLIDASVDKANEDSGTSELLLRMGGVSRQDDP